MIVWLNGPFGVGKTTAVHELGKLLPDVATFDTEEVGFMLRHVLGPAFPGGDFQGLRAWRRLSVTAIVEVSEYLKKDIIVPQSVLVESYWDELQHGLTQSGAQTLCLTLHAEQAELTRRITTDTVESDAAEWRLDHIAAYLSALPWLSQKTTLLDTTALVPTETARLIVSAMGTHA